MLAMKAKDICEAVQGSWISGDPDKVMTGISTDSRSLTPGEFFIPIKGDNFDGHDYILKAVGRGASGFFIQKGYKLNGLESRKDIAVIEVPDPKYAMGELAKKYLKKFNVEIIGITGSNGKTSTKEMIASILEKAMPILKNEGSFNNDIGVPLTVFKLTRLHKVLVTEIGMNHAGEIRRLVSICPPDIGVITNVGEAHIEFFGSLAKIAEAKYELLEEMTEKNIAVLNADDARVAAFSKRTKAASVFFGTNGHKATFWASDIQFNKNPWGVKFILHTPGGETDVLLPILGEHQVSNALAATAAVWQILPDLNVIKKGLESFKPAKMRMQLIPVKGFTLINDAYNANPRSMASALDTLNKLEPEGKKWIVLGDMRELGEQGESSHREIGKKVVLSGDVDYLLTVGQSAHWIAEGAREEAGDATRVIEFSNNQEVIDYLKNNLESGDLVLLKASRKMEFEKISDAILLWSTGAENQKNPVKDQV
jgi:UDP-N-acetylmuramoyl-tripeptide--D-alanyl-D-alanine ligase